MAMVNDENENSRHDEDVDEDDLLTEAELEAEDVSEADMIDRLGPLWEKLVDKSAKGKVKFALPKSIYASVMMMNLLPGDDVRWSLVHWLLILPQWFLVILNDCIQAGFIYYLFTESVKIQPCEIQTSLGLRILAVILFVANMIGEHLENVEMLQWTWYAYRAAPSRGYTGQHQALLVTDKQKLMSRLKCTEAVAFLVLVIMPKVVIAVLLSVSGSMFVVMSESDQDLLLNCLAVQFIIEVDELLYNVFTPSAITALLDRPLIVETSENQSYQTFFNLFISPYVKILVCGLWVASVFGSRWGYCTKVLGVTMNITLA